MLPTWYPDAAGLAPQRGPESYTLGRTAPGRRRDIIDRETKGGHA